MNYINDINNVKIQILKFSLLSIVSMFVVNWVLLGNLYKQNYVNVLCVYVVAFGFVYISFYLYANRDVSKMRYLLFKLVIIALIELGLSLNSYENILRQEKLQIQQSVDANKVELLTNTIKKHNDGINDLRDDLMNIVLNSCKNTRQQNEELAKLNAIHLPEISITDNAHTITPIDVNSLRLKCSKIAVETRVKSINIIRNNIVNMIDLKGEYENKNSLRNNNNNLALFINEYGYKLILSMMILLPIQHALFNNKLNKMRFYSAMSDQYFPREQMINLILKPNTMADSEIQKKNDKRNIFVRFFISFFKNKKSEKYLKNKLFIKLHKKDHNHLIDLLHSNAHKISNKCRIANSHEIKKLIDCRIIQESDIKDFSIYYVDIKLFNEYQSYHTRLQ